MKYEYKSVFINYHSDLFFNDLLKEGWEPIRETANYPGSGIYQSIWLCILRRPLDKNAEIGYTEEVG